MDTGGFNWSIMNILGPALTGAGGTKKITDTDAGALDGDKAWDRAVGSMQFLPSTWRAYAVDADDDQLADPFDLDDAALAAAYYLCTSGKDMTVVAEAGDGAAAVPSAASQRTGGRRGCSPGARTGRSWTAE